jgi:hypothetical protein
LKRLPVGLEVLKRLPAWGCVVAGLLKRLPAGLEVLKRPPVAPGCVDVPKRLPAG